MLLEHDLPEGVVEVPVEDGVDDGVARRVGVGQPPDDGHDLRIDVVARVEGHELEKTTSG